MGKNLSSVIQIKSEDIKSENVKLRNENAQLHQRMAQLENGSANNINFEVVFAAVDEHYLRREKKNNMVIHFLPDDNNDPEQDLRGVKDLATQIDGNPDNILEATRMGNPRDDGKPRMLKVKCDNSHTKRMLITGQEKLRKKIPILAKFFIRDDMTDRQREEDKKRRDKLVLLRAAHKDKILVIRDDKIMEKRGKDVRPFTE